VCEYWSREYKNNFFLNLLHITSKICSVELRKKTLSRANPGGLTISPGVGKLCLENRSKKLHMFRWLERGPIMSMWK
jgi:hypothetical protein